MVAYLDFLLEFVLLKELLFVLHAATLQPHRFEVLLDVVQAVVEGPQGKAEFGLSSIHGTDQKHQHTHHLAIGDVFEIQSPKQSFQKLFLDLSLS